MLQVTGHNSNAQFTGAALEFIIVAMKGQRTIYTPSELNHEARLHLEAGFGRVWLKGEISNISRPASGHLYFSLKDDKAQVSCAFFRFNLAAVPFRPENGMLVQARGRVSLYEARGSYQLIVDAMEEAGEGKLRAAFEELKKKLKAEGLFEEVRKQPLPAYPARVAVITSPSGAVIRDVLHILRRRWPLAAVRLYPVPVQGDEAPAAIIAALRAANRHNWAQTIILCRGGGSLEDLHAFNEESVARAVADSAIPLISAVGHETDFSIADFVADLRAPTPSAAAEMLTPDRRTLEQSFAGLEQHLKRRMQACIQGFGQGLDHLAHRLARQHPGHRAQEHRKLLAQLSSRLSAAGLRLAPNLRLRLRVSSGRITKLGNQMVAGRRQVLQELARTLNAVSPLPTLDRGYAILSSADDGLTLDSVGKVRKGQSISAQLKDGRVHANVDRVTAEKLDDAKTEP